MLIGDSGANSLTPGHGADVALGRGGSDALGDEPATEGDAGDRLVGGRGEDWIGGSSGPDSIDGGPGRDVVGGEGGDDRLDLLDGAYDDVDCGAGSDTVELDRYDFFVNTDPSARPGVPLDRSFGGPCEEVRRDVPTGAVFRVPQAGSLYREARVAVVELGCSGDGPSPCAGTVRLDVAGRRGRAVTFMIARDDFGMLRVKVPERQGRLLRPAILVVETARPGGGASSLVYRTEV